MITTFILNPGVELNIQAESVKLGESNLTGEIASTLGGEGVNASVLLRALGDSCRCGGIAFADRAAELESKLLGHGVSCDFITAPGVFRTVVRLTEDKTGTVTRLHSQGAAVAAKILASAEELAVKLSRESEAIIFCGDLPLGCPPDFYRRLIRKVKRSHAKVALDCSGSALLEAIKEHPWLIRLETEDLKQAFGCRSDEPGEILSACGRILSIGVGMACVSLGDKGALIADRSGSAFFAEWTGDSAFSAGCCMTAGICKAATEGRSLEDTLRFAVAMSELSTRMKRGAPIYPDDLYELCAKVKIRRLQV